MLFTSEQVSNGHPDKICDQISDAIVTDCLLNDRNSRVAVECLIKDYDITIAGEITSQHMPDFKDLTYSVLAGIGLPSIEKYTVNRFISKQSADIALGVDQQGAGDQGMMFGYATNETHEMLPIPFVLATAALERLKDSRNPFLLPDAKSQVTYDYKRKRIDTFLI
ncbi:MAG: methionine adenosyltransferase, partial [Spirochaetales bacterium]|nr:methionine adenosyltransferase [Spirochaetales bacterium]